MKTLTLSILFLALSITAHSQHGYVNIGTSGLIEKKSMNNSITIGAGYKFGRLSTGMTSDFYGIDKSKGQFLIAAFDLRGYVFNKTNSPYISLQPGYTLYNKTIDHIKVKGSWAAAAMAGFEFKPKDVGFNVSVGYQYTSFEVGGILVKGNAFKANLSLLL